MILEKLFQRAETFNPIHPKDPALRELFKGWFPNTESGVSVDPENALESISAVYAAVSIIAETISTLPWLLYRFISGGKELARDDYRFQLLNRKPNRFQNTIEYREMMLISYLLRGRAIAEKIYNNQGRITDLIPLHPTQITPFLAPDGTLAYEHVPEGGKRRVLLSTEVIDVRGMTLDGLNCISPIAANAETLGIAKATDIFAARYFGAGTALGGVLETANVLSDAAYQRLKEWTDRHQGIGRSHNPAILEEGLTWKPVTVNPEDAQLLLTRSYSVEEVARIYRIPAYKLQRMESVKFNTTEQQAIDFVTDTILPKVQRFELSHELGILSDIEQQTMKSEILLKEMLRGDSKTRVEYYKGLWNLGAFSADEMRLEEGYNALPDGLGSRYFVGVNTMPLDKVDELIDSKTRPQPMVPGDQGPDTEQPRALKPFVRSIFERILNAEANAQQRGKSMVPFYEKHKSFIDRVSSPLVESLGEDVKGYFKEYYLSVLRAYESKGPMDNLLELIDIETEKFMMWVKRHG